MRLLISAIAALILIPGALQAQEWPDRLELEHYLDWETAGNPQISPDGDNVLYTRNRVDPVSDSIKGELWIIDADGTRHRFLTEGSSAQWSPSGDRIAFTRAIDGKPQIFVRWMDDEGATSQITHTQNRIKSFQWAPDGETIGFLGEVEMEPAIKIELPARPSGAEWTSDPMITDRLNYRIDRAGLKTGYDHFFVVPADGGTPRQLTSGEWDARSTFSGIPGGSWSFTADSSAIIFDGNMNVDETGPAGVSGINRVALDTGEITTLFNDGGNWAGPVVSPDGRQIAFSGNAQSPVNYPGQEIRLMNIGGGQVQTLRAGLPDSPGNLTWAPNGRGLYYAMNFEGNSNVRYLSTRGDMRQLTQGTHRFFMSSMSDDGTMAGVITSPTVTENVAISDSRGNLDTLTDLNADILSGVSLGETEEIWYESADGTRVQGWIVYPPDFDPARTYPLVLSIHGGPHSMYGVNFNFRFQQWASDGYVVLYTNPRGSTGYTPEFANAIDNAYPGRADYEDLMAGVDTVIERGFIDEENLFVTGCSGGGVLTTWIVTQTDRFAAAAALCPVTNWISFTGQADISAWSFERFRPPYWEDPRPWLEHSPIMHAHQVTTPTLLMTGGQDLRTPLAQAEEFYANLKRRGVPSVLISMTGEYHGTTSIPSNMLRTQLYLDAWFQEHGSFDDEDEDGDADSED